MATTTNILLTYLAEGQRGKEATLNTNMDLLDAAIELNRDNITINAAAIIVAESDLGEFTIANLPNATTKANQYAVATDAIGGPTLVRSNGTSWLIISVIGAVVS